ATAIHTARITSPARDNRLRKNRRTSKESVPVGREAESAAALGIADARVEERIAHIYEEIHCHKGRRDECGRAEHRCVVEPLDGLHEVEADPGPGEYRLDEDISPKEARELNAQHRHRGDQRIA